MLVFARGEGIAEESVAQAVEVSLYVSGGLLLRLVSGSPLSLFVSWKTGSSEDSKQTEPSPLGLTPLCFN